MGRYNRRSNKETTQPDNSTNCTMQQGCPLYHKKRQFRNVKEQQGTWHAHFYSKPPAQPTPHFIVDILGLERRGSSLHNNEEEGTSKKEEKRQESRDNVITDSRKQKNKSKLAKTKIYKESNDDNKVDSTKAKTPVLPKQTTKREHSECSSTKTDDEHDDVKRKKKARTTFTGRQIWELENTFKDKKYLTANERNDLARLLNVTDNQVKIWFQNRRTKWKKYCMCTSGEKNGRKNFTNGYEDSQKLKENGEKFVQRTAETDYDSISDNSCD